MIHLYKPFKPIQILKSYFKYKNIKNLLIFQRLKISRKLPQMNSLHDL